MTPILEAHVYRPVVRGIQWLAERMMHLQRHHPPLSPAIFLVTLVALLVVGILI